MTPALSYLNIQRRTNSTVPQRHSKTHSTINEKYKIDDLLEGPLNCLEVERGHLARIKESNEPQVLRSRLKRTEKILNIMRKEEKKCKIRGTEASE